MRAKPLVTCGLLAGALSLPIPTFALGLGKLTVLSGLGQPLSAQIELTAAQRDELDSLRARIADLSVYRDNNVQFPSALARARVTLEQAANSPPYLRVTTLQAVNEPFLDMIIEINWATGRVVRDYTFLLDPPGTAEAQAVEPSRPIVAQTAPSRDSRSTRRGAASTTTEKASGDSGSGDSYTVRRGDTLSKIAQDYKPDNVSLEQMLVALFRNNESAFDGKNMNRLRTGQIINVPPVGQVTSTTPSDATQIVKLQAADWRAYRDRIAAAAPSTDTAVSRQSSSGKIGAAVEDQGAAAQAGKDQLRLSRESGKGSGAGAGQAEDATARDKALREANARVAELEKTVKDLQKAAELRSQTMAELQARAEAGKSKATEAPKMAPAPTQAVAQPSPAMAPPPPAVAAAPSAAAEVKGPEVKVAETKAPETKAAEPPVPESKAPQAKAEPSAPKAEPAPATVPVKATVPKKAPEPSFLDDVFVNTPTWAVGGGALVVLAGIAGIIAARRRKTTKFEDSIISGTDIKTNTVFGSTGGGVVNTGDNSLASDFSREGLGNIDTDEVDPIAEAEVYLAYGRDAQAEEILKDALKKDAQRQEIYLKLLEIHAQHNKPSAFETVASELYSVSGGQGEVWQKAMALGRQLDPSNPLFADAGGIAASTVATETSRGDEASASSDTQVFSVPPELKPEPRTASALDFSLDEDISLSPTSGVAELKTPAAILAGAEQEVAKSSRSASDAVKEAAMGSAAAIGAAALAKSAAEKPSPVRDTVSFEPESVPKFDLDFQLEEPSIPAASIRPALARAPELEPALAVAASAAPAPQLARPAAAVELDKLDLAFDPQRSTFEDPTPSVLDGQWHDAATKLDLAKAYQEMGDVEGAREILQEVLHEGDDPQRAEAQSLLAKLA